MGLRADLKLIVEQYLKSEKVALPATADLEKLLLLAFNHELKTVSKRPREVHRSTQFEAKLSGLSAKEQLAAERILEKFKIGEDVNAHLSKLSAKPAETDALLADWKIHHLHISIHKLKPADAFFARTGPVMFAHIGQTDAHFIDIYPHGNGFPETWTRQELLRIVNETWPELFKGSAINGKISMDRTPTDLDLKALRQGHVNSILPVGDSFIAPPGGGLATDGTPVVNVLRLNKTLQTLERAKVYMEANSERLRKQINSLSGVPEAALDFNLIEHPEGWAVIERKTKALVLKIPLAG